jgi:lipopolysaccharide/colanic/teichoic acid biosynthesis glycosyltransferase
LKEVLPIKLDYYTEYVKQQSFFGDLKIILATMAAVLRRP